MLVNQNVFSGPNLIFMLSGLDVNLISLGKLHKGNSVWIVSSKSNTAIFMLLEFISNVIYIQGENICEIINDLWVTQ